LIAAWKTRAGSWLRETKTVRSRSQTAIDVTGFLLISLGMPFVLWYVITQDLHPVLWLFERK